MKTKKILRKVFLAVAALIAVIILICLGIRLIDGRSPQAIIVTKMFPKNNMDGYYKAKADTTDKSTVDIPGDVSFPREVKQYRVGGCRCLRWLQKMIQSPSCCIFTAVLI